jgi:hypothetical protein
VSNGPAQRRLILYMSMSLDGFVARRDGVIDWLDPSVKRRAASGDHRHRAISLPARTGQ